MATTVSEILWIRCLLKDLDVAPSEPTHLYCDNQVARQITSNPIFHERMKHIEMDCYFVRERVESVEIQPRKIDIADQIADIFTKALGLDCFRYLFSKMDICDIHAPS